MSLNKRFITYLSGSNSSNSSNPSNPSNQYKLYVLNDIFTITITAINGINETTNILNTNTYPNYQYLNKNGDVTINVVNIQNPDEGIVSQVVVGQIGGCNNDSNCYQDVLETTIETITHQLFKIIEKDINFSNINTHIFNQNSFTFTPNPNTEFIVFQLKNLISYRTENQLGDCICP